jgi:hypothetical protein
LDAALSELLIHLDDGGNDRPLSLGEVDWDIHLTQRWENGVIRLDFFSGFLACWM